MKFKVSLNELLYYEGLEISAVSREHAFAKYLLAVGEGIVKVTNSSFQDLVATKIEGEK